MTRTSILPVSLFALGLVLLILSCVRAHSEPRFAGAMLVYQHTDPAFEKNGLAGGVFFTWQDEGDRTPVTCGIYEGSFGKPAATCNIGFDWATWSLDGLEGALTPLPQSSRSEARKTPIEPNPVPVVAQQSASGDPQSHIRTSDFQALFFKVGGLTLAVPLTELGGIHRLDKVGPLIGKPDWFKGIMLHRQQRLNVVDSAAWIMPEKYDQTLAETLDYQYLIMLNDSHWGLTCESLVNTLTLSPEEVKWRTQTGKRPWLAGMVKDPMCALLNVPELIMLLNKGLGHNQS